MALRDDLLYENFEKIMNPTDITAVNVKNAGNGVYPPLFHLLEKRGMYVLKFFINSA